VDVIIDTRHDEKTTNHSMELSPEKKSMRRSMTKSPNKDGRKESNNSILTRSRSKEDSPRLPDSPDKKNFAVDRYYYITKIQNFYEKNVDGPEKLVSRLLELYRQYTFRESSLQNIYEEYQEQVN
jgi:hypothetical protein